MSVTFCVILTFLLQESQLESYLCNWSRSILLYIHVGMSLYATNTVSTCNVQCDIRPTQQWRSYCVPQCGTIDVHTVFGFQPRSRVTTCLATIEARHSRGHVVALTCADTPSGLILARPIYHFTWWLMWPAKCWGRGWIVRQCCVCLGCIVLATICTSWLCDYGGGHSNNGD